MTAPMTADEIAELRRLDKAAASPPWNDSAAMYASEEYRDSDDIAVERTANSALIAAARNALTSLLDEVEAARELLVYLAVAEDLSEAGRKRLLAYLATVKPHLFR